MDEEMICGPARIPKSQKIVFQPSSLVIPDSKHGRSRPWDGCEFLLNNKYYTQAWDAALRLKIALRLYERQHGQLPDSLSALVPEYLKEVPADPYDGQPFRYSKAEKKIWSIGSDLIDQGGFTHNATLMEVAKGYDLVMPLVTRNMAPQPAPPPAGPPPGQQR